MLKTLTVVKHRLLVFALIFSLNLAGVSIRPVLIHSEKLQQAFLSPILNITYDCLNKDKRIIIPNSFQTSFSVQNAIIGKTFPEIQLKSPVSKNTKDTLFLKFKVSRPHRS